MGDDDFFGFNEGRREGFGEGVFLGGREKRRGFYIWRAPKLYMAGAPAPRL